MAAAAAAGAIHLDPFTIDELDDQHADHIARKIENPARVEALSLEGEPSPTFRQFRRKALTEIAGEERHAAALAGARRRIREGAHREGSSDLRSVSALINRAILGQCTA